MVEEVFPIGRQRSRGPATTSDRNLTLIIFGIVGPFPDIPVEIVDANEPVGVLGYRGGCGAAVSISWDGDEARVGFLRSGIRKIRKTFGRIRALAPGIGGFKLR